MYNAPIDLAGCGMCLILILLTAPGGYRQHCTITFHAAPPATKVPTFGSTSAKKVSNTRMPKLWASQPEQRPQLNINGRPKGCQNVSLEFARNDVIHCHDGMSCSIRLWAPSLGAVRRHKCSPLQPKSAGL